MRSEISDCSHSTYICVFTLMIICLSVFIQNLVFISVFGIVKGNVCLLLTPLCHKVTEQLISILLLLGIMFIIVRTFCKNNRSVRT